MVKSMHRFMTHGPEFGRRNLVAVQNSMDDSDKKVRRSTTRLFRFGQMAFNTALGN